MRSNQAFTLIELAMVLVIIGLLIGSIVAGDYLVHQARLRAVISEINSFKSSINIFRLRFNGLPGDISNAGVIWPTCDATPANCNGNGNGIIQQGSPNDTTNDEGIRAWQHLYLANLIQGAFTGTHTVAGQSDIGINVPASKFIPLGYSFYHTGLYGGETFAAAVMLGGFTAGAISHQGIILSTDSYYWDMKFDDGLPKSGNIRSEAFGGGTCFSGTTYTLSATAGGCDTQFVLLTK